MRLRVDEDVPVVGRDQPDVPRQQHAVAEHVARHVADAATVKSVACVSTPSSRKWRLTLSQAPRAVMPMALWS